MTEIASLVSELKSLDTEIKTRAIELSKLRKRQESIKDQILNYLEEEKKPGLKHNGTIVMTEDKSTRLRKKKAEKAQDCINVLKHYGIHNADKIWKELQEVVKGDKTQKKILKIT
jgi:hypothetical protein